MTASICLGHSCALPAPLLRPNSLEMSRPASPRQVSRRRKPWTGQAGSSELLGGPRQIVEGVRDFK